MPELPSRWWSTQGPIIRTKPPSSLSFHLDWFLPDPSSAGIFSLFPSLFIFFFLRFLSFPSLLRDCEHYASRTTSGTGQEVARDQQGQACGEYSRYLAKLLRLIRALKFNRITQTRYTRLYFFLSAFSCLLLCALQAVILSDNTKAVDILTAAVDEAEPAPHITILKDGELHVCDSIPDRQDSNCVVLWLSTSNTNGPLSVQRRVRLVANTPPPKPPLTPGPSRVLDALAEPGFVGKSRPWRKRRAQTQRMREASRATTKEVYLVRMKGVFPATTKRMGKRKRLQELAGTRLPQRSLRHHPRLPLYPRRRLRAGRRPSPSLLPRAQVPPPLSSQLHPPGALFLLQQEFQTPTVRWATFR